MTSARPSANCRQCSQSPPPMARPTTRVSGASRARNGSSTSIACSCSVRGGVELEAGEWRPQGRASSGSEGNRRAGDRPRLVRRHGQVDPVAGVLRPDDDHQLGDLQAIEHRGRELARVGQARVRHHGRRPRLGLPLAGAEQAVDQAGRARPGRPG